MWQAPYRRSSAPRSPSRGVLGIAEQCSRAAHRQAGDDDVPVAGEPDGDGERRQSATNGDEPVSTVAELGGDQGEEDRGKGEVEAVALGFGDQAADHRRLHEHRGHEGEREDDALAKSAAAQAVGQAIATEFPGEPVAPLSGSGLKDHANSYALSAASASRSRFSLMKMPFIVIQMA